MCTVVRADPFEMFTRDSQAWHCNMFKLVAQIQNQLVRFPYIRYTITDHIQICSSKSRDLEKTSVLPTNMDASLGQHSVQTERQICL